MKVTKKSSVENEKYVRKLWSKKYKLKKEYWQKGRSKFIFCRLQEEGKIELAKRREKISFLDNAEMIIHVPWWKKLIRFILNKK